MKHLIDMTSLVPHGVMFHHFFDKKHPGDPGAISANQLARLIEHIGPAKIILPEEWIYRVEKNKLRKSDVCLTFDDTLLCQYEVALPVLKSYSIKLFVCVFFSN